MDVCCLIVLLTVMKGNLQDSKIVGPGLAFYSQHLAQILTIAIRTKH